MFKKIFLGMAALGTLMMQFSQISVASAVYQTNFTYEAESLNTEIGDTAYYPTDGANGTPITVMKGDTNIDDPGFLVYGPYSTTQLPHVPYRAIFNMRVASSSALPVARIEVNNFGNELLADREIFSSDFSALNTFENFTLDFIRPDLGSMEYRVYFYDTANVEIDKITIKQIAPSDNITYESEDLRHGIGSKISDGSASDGYAVKSIIADGPGYLQYGPYSVYQELNNTFVAKFRLKTSDNSSDSTIIRVDASNSHGNGIWSYLDIKGTDFNASDTYQDFFLKFSRVNEGSMEYRVYTYGLTDVTTDYVEVNKITKSSSGYQSEDLGRQVGTVISDTNASEGLAVEVDSTEVGFAQYGPYTVDQAPGYNYRAVFRMMTNNNTSNAPLARLEVVNYNGLGSWQSRTIKANDFVKTNNFEEFGIDFTRGSSGLVEYRVYTFGNSQSINFILDKVDVYKRNNTSWDYEAEDMYGSIGDLMLDETASGGKSREATVVSDNTGFMLYGPYNDELPYNKTYQATFRLKTRNNASNNVVARLEVVNPKGTAQFMQKNITGDMFSNRDTWQDFSLNFARRAGGSMEYRVYFYDSADVMVDKVSVKQLDDSNIVYESENMFNGVGSIIADASASGGFAAKSEVSDGAGYLVYGPYSIDQSPGNYKVTFRLKNYGTADGNVIRIEAKNNDGSGSFVYRYLDKNAVKSSYTDQYLYFYRTGEGNMEYRVYTSGLSDVTVDNITVEKIS